VKKSLLKIAKLLVTISLLVYLFSKLNLSVLPERIEAIRWMPFFLCILLGHADRILMALKWRFLIQSSGVTITASKAMIITYMGNFAGQFLPAGLGGDIARIFLLRNLKLPVTEVAGSIAVERILGLTALVITSILSLFAGRLWGIRAPNRMGWMLFGILALIVLFMLLSFSPLFKKSAQWRIRFSERFSLIKKIYHVVECYQQYSRRRGTLIIFFLLSMLEVLTVTVIFYLCCKALYIELGLVQMLMVIPVVLIIQRIPISINGIGVQEGLLGYYFLQLGESLESAIVLSIILRVLQVIILSPGGFFYLIKFRTPSSANV
jgi:uncharacterized protein (TIRG00374 family)